MLVELKDERLQARQANEDDSWTRPPADTGSIEMGTVGWGDQDIHYDAGTASNDGVTLIKVTLFRGRDPKQEHTPGLGQGAQILARNSAGENIPSKGTQVIVARPAGFDGPGCWHIIANPGAGAGPILPSEGGTFQRRKPDGSCTMGTTTDGTKDGQLVYFQVKRDGFEWLAPWGKITFDVNGLHVLHHTGARLDLGGIGGIPAPLDVIASYAGMSAGIVKLEGSAVALGTSTAPSDNVALASAVLATFGAMQTQFFLIDAALIAIGTALSGLGAGGAAAAITAETAGLGPLTTAVTAATVSVPSASTGST